MSKYLVVFEDIWNVKEHYQTNYIGNTIQEILDEKGLYAEFDKEKYNSNEPYQAGTFGNCFYDIDVYEADWECIDDEYAGRIMIFDLIEGDD